VVFEFMSRILGRKNRPGSKDLAKERLKLVLAQDRVDISPQMFERLRRDLATACAKYVEIDAANMDVRFDSGDRTLALIASVPVIGTKRDSYNSRRRGNMG